MRRGCWCPVSFERTTVVRPFLSFHLYPGGQTRVPRLALSTHGKGQERTLASVKGGIGLLCIHLWQRHGELVAWWWVPRGGQSHRGWMGRLAWGCGWFMQRIPLFLPAWRMLGRLLDLEERTLLRHGCEQARVQPSEATEACAVFPLKWAQRREKPLLRRWQETCGCEQASMWPSEATKVHAGFPLKRVQGSGWWGSVCGRTLSP